MCNKMSIEEGVTSPHRCVVSVESLITRGCLIGESLLSLRCRKRLQQTKSVSVLLYAESLQTLAVVPQLQCRNHELSTL